MTDGTRQLHLGAILGGVGMTQNEWLHPDIPGDASVNIDWYIETARRAEAAKFDFVFVVEPMLLSNGYFQMILIQ